ncbi:MAG TPA: GMP/IMP nucleotidase [Chromatiales bacterium]|nr:GMP/IMP nucleotidase [Chromatiales bacterium]
MLDWNHIDTVLLDMDGTLLDLNFDNHFWREHVPLRYAEKQGLDLETAKQELFPRFRNAEGTIDWYCVDFWSAQLGLDIPMLKQEVDHLIAIHPHVVEFLGRLRQRGKQRILVTNAHHKSLMLKLDRTALHDHLDDIICAHDFRVPKEQDAFWEKLQQRLPFAKDRTLLVDDSLPVLRSARNYGIRHLLAVRNPDSRNPGKDPEEFQAIVDFRDIMPENPGRGTGNG